MKLNTFIILMLTLISYVSTNEEDSPIDLNTGLITDKLENTYDTLSKSITINHLRPRRFRNKQQFKNFLMKLHEYYAIVGRPRFGRSIDKNKATNCQAQIERYHQMVINLIDNFLH
jgi:hypothetical protein